MSDNITRGRGQHLGQGRRGLRRGRGNDQIRTNDDTEIYENQSQIYNSQNDYIRRTNHPEHTRYQTNNPTMQILQNTRWWNPSDRDNQPIDTSTHLDLNSGTSTQDINRYVQPNSYPNTIQPTDYVHSIAQNSLLNALTSPIEQLFPTPITNPYDVQILPQTISLTDLPNPQLSDQTTTSEGTQPYSGPLDQLTKKDTSRSLSQNDIITIHQRMNNYFARSYDQNGHLELTPYPIAPDQDPTLPYGILEETLEGYYQLHFTNNPHDIQFPNKKHFLTIQRDYPGSNDDVALLSLEHAAQEQLAIEQRIQNTTERHRFHTDLLNLSLTNQPESSSKNEDRPPKATKSHTEIDYSHKKTGNHSYQKNIQTIASGVIEDFKNNRAVSGIYSQITKKEEIRELMAVLSKADSQNIYAEKINRLRRNLYTNTLKRNEKNSKTSKEHIKRTKRAYQKIKLEAINRGTSTTKQKDHNIIEKTGLSNGQLRTRANNLKDIVSKEELRRLCELAHTEEKKLQQQIKNKSIDTSSNWPEGVQHPAPPTHLFDSQGRQRAIQLHYGSGDRLNCLLYGLLGAQGHDTSSTQTQELATRTGEIVRQVYGTGRNYMLTASSIYDHIGYAAALLRDRYTQDSNQNIPHPQGIDPNRGVTIHRYRYNFTQQRIELERAEIIRSENSIPPLELYLDETPGNEHFYWIQYLPNNGGNQFQN